MARPQSWLNDYDLDLSSTPSPSVSGRNSPHERQRMLASAGDDGALPTRLPYPVPTPSSPIRSRPSLVGSHDSLTFERPRSAAPDLPPRTSRVLPSSPLNPSSPPLSPFARPGSRASAHITRIPSEESRVLALAAPLPLAALTHQSSRGSMILYRRAAPDDDLLLHPPTRPPHNHNRNSFASTSGESVVSLSSDSKYPAGALQLVAYAYDPSFDENEPPDEEDTLHDPEGALVKVAGRPVSWRGVKNLSALVVMVAGLLALFVVYPVYLHYQDNGVMQLIVGNTRINATGQASAVEFDTREARERTRGAQALLV